jgi:site-specific recombinase XerD
MNSDIQAFLRFLELQDRSDSTLEGYRINLTLFADWFERTNKKPMAPALVTPIDLKTYRKYLQDNRRAPGTINQKLKQIKSFFGWAVAQGLATGNPASKIKLLRQGKRAPKWLDRQETYAVIRTTEEAVQLAELHGSPLKILVAKRTAAMVALMLHAGLRLSEVCQLSPSDVDIRPRSGKVTVWQGKGNKYRQVPLNADVRQALADWLEVWTGDRYLFDNRQTGRPLNRRTIQYFLARLGRAAGLSHRLTPHQLRHTFGKSLVNQGVTLDRIAMLMGHTDLKTTAMYTTPSLSDLADDVDLISWQD